MNVELLRKVQAHILAEPARIFMGDWIMDSRAIALHFLQQPACNTVACISGWAAILSGHPEDAVNGKIYLELQYPQQTSRLFYVSSWPKDFAQRIVQTRKQSPEYARIVADRIEHFIATDGRE